MQPILKSEIFFFISSVSLAIFSIIFIIMGIYLIKILKNFADISDKLKKSVDSASDEIAQLAENVKDSPVFKFMFGHRKRTKKENSEV